MQLWVGDATAVPVEDESFDAVFDFGIIHHVPHWRAALGEVHRVLKPDGRFYAEEVLGRFVTHPVERQHGYCNIRICSPSPSFHNSHMACATDVRLP